MTILWDKDRTILERLMKERTSVNSASYCNMLTNELKHIIQARCWGLISRQTSLQHNTHFHTAHANTDTIKCLQHEVAPHPLIYCLSYPRVLIIVHSFCNYLLKYSLSLKCKFFLSSKSHCLSCNRAQKVVLILMLQPNPCKLLYQYML